MIALPKAADVVALREKIRRTEERTRECGKQRFFDALAAWLVLDDESFKRRMCESDAFKIIMEDEDSDEYADYFNEDGLGCISPIELRDDCDGRFLLKISYRIGLDAGLVNIEWAVYGSRKEFIIYGDAKFIRECAPYLERNGFSVASACSGPYEAGLKVTNPHDI